MKTEKPNGVAHNERGKWETFPPDKLRKAMGTKVTPPRWKVTAMHNEPDQGVQVLDFYVYAVNKKAALALVQAGTFRHPKRPLDDAKPIAEWADTLVATPDEGEHQAKLVQGYYEPGQRK